VIFAKIFAKIALIASTLLLGAIGVSGRGLSANFFEGAHERPIAPEFVADLLNVQPPEFEQSATANLSITVNPASGGQTCASNLPCTTGWYAIPNTALQPVIPT
jgi:hypothetical protein